jgi:two-component system, OmpR family, phosphate regulon response regulator PhoB
MARILVVEDEEAIADLVGLHLRRANHEVQWARNGESARAAVRERLPDLILLDWMLPGVTGLDLAKQWRAESRTKDLAIIFLTARQTESDRTQGLDQGADDYIVKPFSPMEMMARIRAVLRRRSPMASDSQIRQGDIALDPSQKRVLINADQSNEMPLALSPREFSLLHFFMAHPNRSYSRAQLLDLVWGDHQYLEERTVDVHVKRLRESLSKTSLNDALETVRGHGYLWRNKART